MEDMTIYDAVSYLQRQQRKTEQRLQIVIDHLQKTGQLQQIQKGRTADGSDGDGGLQS